MVLRSRVGRLTVGLALGRRENGGQGWRRGELTGFDTPGHGWTLFFPLGRTWYFRQEGHGV